LQQNKHTVLHAGLVIDDDFEFASLDVAGWLRPPDGFDLGYLMAKSVIHKLLHDHNECFGFDVP
jgi:hypothetical protein